MVDTEVRGTVAVEDALSLCPHLVAYISKKDKTPITDGHIDLYSGLGRRKTEITGRLPVQVKGHLAPGKLAPSSYRMTRDELTSIRNHGTVLFFVTFLHRDGTFHGRPRYAILSPYFVDQYLDEFPKKQNSFSVPVKELPAAADEIERLVALAIRSQKQSVFFGSTDALIMRSKRFAVHSTSDLDFSTPLTISPRHGDFVIEVETHEGIIAPLPGVMEVYPPSYRERDVPINVRCGAVEYQGATIRQVDAEHFHLKLSGGMVLDLRSIEKLESASAILTLSDSFTERSRDVTFFVALASGQPLYMDGQQLAVEINEPAQFADLLAIQDQLDLLTELFDVLHVDPGLIDLSRVTEEQFAQLSYVHGSLLHRRSLRASGDESPLVYVEAGEWKLALMLLPDGEEQTLQCADPFAPEDRDRFRLYSTDEAGERIERQATVYDILDSTQLAEYVNTNLAQVVPAYEAVAEVRGTTWLAVRTMLNLIRAADVCERRRKVLLDAAEALNDWIAAKTGPSTTDALNRLQITARRPNGLGEDERRAVRTLRRDIVSGGRSSAALNETACAILLGDVDDIEECVARLEKSQLDELREYPIWNLVQAPARMHEA